MQKILILCMVVAAGAAHSVHLSKEQKEKVRQHSAECVKESGVKPELLAQAKKGQFADDEALKKFTLCFFKKSGLLTKDGHINTEAALSKLPAGADKAAIGKVLDECKNKKGKDAADTAFEIYKCYYKGTPTHLLF